jgi:cyclopropane-fatty-acyl-phospholipid synthase
MGIASTGYQGGVTKRAAARIVPALASRLVLGRLERWSQGALEIHLPDGSVRSVGAAASEDPPLRLRIHDARFFTRALTSGDIGVGESYMAGEWDSSDLVALVSGYLREASVIDHESPFQWLTTLGHRLRRRLDANTRSGSRRNIHRHYDLSNELFASFLDETLTYSSAVFEPANLCLAGAQLTKIDGACRALGLRPGDELLEIGSGWGTLAMHAAMAYGCRVTSITLSEEQRRLAESRAREAGLEDQISFRLCDYRDIDGTYDHIVSIEMLEAVGAEFHGEFFSRCDRLLRPGGRLFLQSIVVPDRRFEAYCREFDWIRKYIYPGGCLASHGAIASALARHTSMRVEWMREIGPHYEKTVRLWRERFLANRSEIRALGFDERFLRMWELYLAGCEAAFAVGHVGNLQMLIGRAGEATLTSPAEINDDRADYSGIAATWPG